MKWKRFFFFFETPLIGEQEWVNPMVNRIVNGIYISIFIYVCRYALGFVRPGKNLELVSQSIYTYIYNH